MAHNVLYLIDRLDRGGTENQLIHLINGLDKNQFTPHLCTLKKSKVSIEELGISHLFIPFKGFFHISIFSNLLSLVSYIHKNDIKIIQTFFQDPFLLAALSRFFHRSKLVGSFRDLGFWRDSRESVKMRVAYPFFTHFIANSEAVKKHIKSIDGIRTNKISVVYNGVEVNREVVTKKNGYEFGPPTVGIVANCNREVKRVDAFIRAAKIIHCKLPEVRFVIIGDGHLRPTLENLSNELGLNEVLTFKGSVKYPLKYIRTLSVGLITSESEGLCNAILEYMSCGVPVVATNVGGNPELVEDGKNGFLVPVGDVSCLAEKTIRILTKDQSRNNMKRESLMMVKSKFSIEAMVNNTQKIYYDIISN